MLDGEKIIFEKDNNKIECDVLFSFDCNENGKTYVGYSDHSKDNDGKETILVSRFNTLDGNELESLTEPEEWNMVTNVIQNIKTGGDFNA